MSSVTGAENPAILNHHSIATGKTIFATKNVMENGSVPEGYQRRLICKIRSALHNNLPLDHPARECVEEVCTGWGICRNCVERIELSEER
ncbi:MAG: hypothetical protein PHH09_10570 [Methanoregulaceae archaeon]|nr:hypothetical protein [Methanoregulaceae archaeon]